MAELSLVRPVTASKSQACREEDTSGPARRCFWQLGYEVNFLRRLEVRQMITSVIAQLGFPRGRAGF